MTGLLAADVAAAFAHPLDDVAVAHRGTMQGEAEPLQMALEAEIGHHGGDNAVARHLAGGVPRGGDKRHQLIAVDEPAALVGDQQAVGVAVEGDADIGAAGDDLALHRRRRHGAAILVDVEPVGRDASGMTSAPSSQSTVGATL